MIIRRKVHRKKVKGKSIPFQSGSKTNPDLHVGIAQEQETQKNNAHAPLGNRRTPNKRKRRRNWHVSEIDHQQGRTQVGTQTYPIRQKEQRINHGRLVPSARRLRNSTSYSTEIDHPRGRTQVGTQNVPCKAERTENIPRPPLFQVRADYAILRHGVKVLKVLQSEEAPTMRVLQKPDIVFLRASLRPKYPVVRTRWIHGTHVEGGCPTFITT
ncbi:unnamed protein product [Ectocarpus sp. 8 AP-2014]